MTTARQEGGSLPAKLPPGISRNGVLWHAAKVLKVPDR
jgi:hypothetical protein